MSGVDVQRLLQPVSDEQPCGVDLDGTPEFQALGIAATRRPETVINDRVTPAEEPDWADVRERAVSLLEQSKHVQLVIHLTEGLIHTHGFAGLRDGLALMHGLLETHWDALHPALDPGDPDGAASWRLNQLKGLGDRGRIVRPLRDVKLPGTRMLGSYSLSEGEALRRAATEGEEGAAEKLSSFEAALVEANPDELRTTLSAVRESRQLLGTIQTLIDERADVSEELGLGDLDDSLADIETLVREFLARRGESAGETEVSVGNGAADEAMPNPAPAATVQTPPGKITSRADVIRALDQVCLYYEEFEPSSPVPLLLRRAKRLVAKDFLSILRDVAPGGIEQAEVVTGAGNGSDED